MEILEVEPLRMIPPKESASNSIDVSDSDSPTKVSAFPANSANQLPPGWTVVKKIKSSGSAYKVYIDPVTGMKFYSRRRVLDYLQNQTQCRPPNKRIPAKTTPGQHVDWLPTDWAVEIKMKMSGRSAGSRYKVYVEKSTGKKFYSQRQALDYLMPSRSSSPEIENVQSVRSENHPDWLPQDWSVQTENESGGSDSIAKRKDKVTGTDREEQDAKGLPPGWFKAIRYRESRAGTRTKIALYVDPMSGYAFFSTKDAQRYIDSGTTEDCRMKPKRWSEISKDTSGNKLHSKPTAEEREFKPEERKGKRPLFTEKTYGGTSEEDRIEIEDSDEESMPKPKEKIETKSLFSEEKCDMNLEDVIETNDLQIGAEETSTNENDKEKMPATPPLRRTGIKVLASKPRPFICCSELTSPKPLTSTNEDERSPLRRTRIKVLASKARPFLRCSKSTSPEPLTSNPSSVCPVQTNLRSDGENPEPKPKMQIPEEESSHQVASEVIESEKTKASPSSLLGQSSLDSCLEFAFKTLTEDILVFDKK